MNYQEDFAKTYEGMSDGQLLQVANERGLIDEAKKNLAAELRRRNLKPSDLPRHKESQGSRLRREASTQTVPSRLGPTGLMFFGRHYLSQADKEADIQIRTRWIAFCGLPLFPLASYRFKCKQQGWRFLHWTDQVVINRVQLNWDQVFLTWLKASPFYLVILMLLWGWIRFRHH